MWEYAAAISDIRVSFPDGRTLDCLQKVYPVGRFIAAALAVSYILLLTAFYVDNGPHLPLWRSLPPLAYWVLPSIVGLPILIWALRRHPLSLRSASPN